MSLFKIDPTNYQLVIDNSSNWLGIKEFQVLLTLNYNKAGKGDSDGRERRRGLSELKFLYYMYDFTSPYATYSHKEKLSRSLSTASLEVEPKSKEFNAARDLYIEIQDQNLALKSCKVAEDTVNRIIDTLSNLVYGAEDEDVIDKMQKTTAMLDKMMDLSKKVAKERELVMASLSKPLQGRGGVQISSREDPNRALKKV